MMIKTKNGFELYVPHIDINLPADWYDRKIDWYSQIDEFAKRLLDHVFEKTGYRLTMYETEKTAWGFMCSVPEELKNFDVIAGAIESFDYEKKG